MTDAGPDERDRPVEGPPTPPVPAPLTLMPLSRRQARLIDILLLLATIGLGIVVIGMLGQVFFAFGDVILIFFLAWLVAFVLSPVVRWIVEHVPRLPRVVAVVLIYLALIFGLLAIVVSIAQALAIGLAEFIAELPKLLADLPGILAPLQSWLDQFGFGQVDLQALAAQILQSLRDSATTIVGPLQSIAVASVGAMGPVLIVTILSVYIVIDQDRIQAFLNRMVPPGQRDDVRHLEHSVSRSFGGFLRGQTAIGFAYAAIALATSAVLGLDFIAVTTAASGLLMAIPFFGPFVSWAPPVIVAIFTQPTLILPTLAIMMVGWFIVMNVLQPRLMADAVGLHPIVVLASVIVGSKIAGVSGAIFGIPIAAVISSLFFHYLEIFGEDRTVAARAARRVETREGRRIRVPREPQPGVDADVEETGPG
ncbi:MAG: AI-2E family transporter [Candidatus Limnocylindrales bacterium]